MANTSPIFNALFLRWILYSIIALCKHVHKKGQIGGESIVKLGFDKSQSREIVFILHTTTTCTIANSTTFTYSWKLVTKMWEVVTRCHIPIRRLVSKGRTCMVLHLTSLSIWTCPIGIQSHLYLGVQALKPPPHLKFGYCHNQNPFQEL
jgi:hypothetical protein